MEAANMKRIQLSPIRKIISERMTESFKIPQFNLQIEVGMDNLSRIRKTMDSAPSVTACLVWACSRALRQQPELNGYFLNNELYLVSDINIGVAASLPEGLIVPVIKNADQKSLPQIAGELDTLVDKAKQKRLSPDDLQNGTFTLSNLGMHQIKSFNPIINPPQLAIMGIGGPQTNLKMVSGEIQEYKFINVTLTSDHRVIDGAIAAQFLVFFKKFCQDFIVEDGKHHSSDVNP